MKGFGKEEKARKKKLKKTTSQNQTLINLAINLLSQGKIEEASKYYKYFHLVDGVEYCPIIEKRLAYRKRFEELEKNFNHGN